MAFEHGGELRRAASHYGMPLEQWLDLSTGISPHAWPVPAVPTSIWHRLPEDDDGLLAAAASYYGVDERFLTAVAGSQAAIQAVPRLLDPGMVVLPQPTFSEHGKAWQAAGHQLFAVAPYALDNAIMSNDCCRYAVVVSPNNPTGERYPPAQLERWRQQLEARGGLLLVDEAFMDATPEQSVLQTALKPGLVVLRSVGKFFGLAGLRLGFAMAQPGLGRRLRTALGPWEVSHPARFLGQQVLSDTAWQAQARRRLMSEQERLYQLLRKFVGECAHTLEPQPPTGCALFQSLHMPQDAEALFDHFSRRAILIRLFADSGWIRFGLPPGEPGWRRLEEALENFRRDQCL